MTNKIILEGIKEAGDLMNEVEGVPLEQRNTIYNLVDGILSNLQVYTANNEEAWNKIKDKDKKIMIEYNKKLNEARNEIKKIDPLYQWQDGMKYITDLRHWKCKETLAFWNIITKEYDL